MVTCSCMWGSSSFRIRCRSSVFAGDVLSLIHISSIGKPVWIRHVLVPQRNDSDEDLRRLDAFVRTLSNVERFEVLPYHTLGVYKWKELGIPYPLEGIDPPGQALIDHANAMRCV